MRNRFPLDSYHLSSGRLASVYGTFQTQKTQGEIAIFFPTKTGWWYTYPSEKYENQLGLRTSQYDWQVIKFHGSSHHQPDNHVEYWYMFTIDIIGMESSLLLVTLWLFNIAMEHGLFIDDFAIKTSIYKGFSMAMLVITRW